MAILVNQHFIGSGSVITKDIDDYKVIVGNPARVVWNLRQNQPISAVVERTN